MFKQAAIAILLAAIVTGPASAETKKEGGDIPWTYAEFQLDCETSGGTAVFVKGTAACDYPGIEDIVCDAGGGSVGACTPGTIFGGVARPKERTGRINEHQTVQSATPAPSRSTGKPSRERRVRERVLLPGDLFPVPTSDQETR